MSKRARLRCVGVGQLVPMGLRVFRIGGVPVTWKTRVLAVCLSLGPDAVVSHQTAAAVWGLDGFRPPATIDVSVPRRRRPAARDGVRIHQCRDFELANRAARGGIPVTGLARTVLDVCAVSSPETALRALDAALRRPTRVAWAALRECLVLHARRGRPGVALYRAVLQRRNMKPPPGDKFVALVLELLLDSGLPVPECEYRVTVRGRRYRLDIAYPQWKVGGECDGKEGHDNERAFEEDPIRDNALQLDGWLMLHFPWAGLVNDPAGIVAEVRDAIRVRSGAGTEPSAVASKAR